MKVACIAALSLILAAFAPEQGQNTMTCQTQDYVHGGRMDVTYDFKVIGDEYFVTSDVKMSGTYRDDFIQRTLRGNTFTLEMRPDRDGVERFTLATKPESEERLTWVHRDEPLSDAIDFMLPATKTQPARWGALNGHLPGYGPSPSEARTEIVNPDIPFQAVLPGTPARPNVRSIVAGCEVHAKDSTTRPSDQ